MPLLSSSSSSSWILLRYLLVEMHLLLLLLVIDGALATTTSTTTNGDASMPYPQHNISSSRNGKIDASLTNQDNILHRRISPRRKRHASTVPTPPSSSKHVMNNEQTYNMDFERKELLSETVRDINTTFISPSTSPSSPTTLLTSPWWTKIKECAGPHSYNFVPGSRRAASSVVYTYSFTPDADDEEEPHRRHNHHRSMWTSDATKVLQDRRDTESIAFTNGTNDSFTSGEITSNTTRIHPLAASSSSMNLTQHAETDAINATSQQHHGPTTKNVLTTKDKRVILNEEYMIVSGGYTDHDWKTFPVYAFPITSAIHTQSGQWIDLTPSASKYDDVDTAACHELVGDAALANLSQEAKFIDDTTSTSTTKNNSTEEEEEEENDDPWKHASPCSPFGRMGHISVIYDDKLYVFGGLIYAEEEQQVVPGGSGGGYYYGRRTMFQLENIPYVYRLDLKEMLDARRAESEGATELLMKKKITGWQRIIPRVKKSSNINNGKSSASSLSAAEVLLTLVNRGEMQGGLWSSESSGGHDKLVMHGGLRIEKVDYDSYGLPSRTSSQIVELPLADIWAYDLVLDCWEKVTNTYGKVREKNAVVYCMTIFFRIKINKKYMILWWQGISVEDSTSETNSTQSAENTHDEKNTDTEDDDWWSDLGPDFSVYPRPRTAHAATIVGNELIIHGGMGGNEHTDEWDGSTSWESLGDMWIFDLNTREWTRRWLFPLLVRSYHTLVGWSVSDDMIGWGGKFENDTSWKGPIVAAFGGYTPGMDDFSGAVSILRPCTITVSIKTNPYFECIFARMP